MSLVPSSPEMLTVRVSSSSHRITVIAEDRHEVDVEGRATVTPIDDAMTGKTIDIIDVESKISVRVPLGTRVVVGSSSGRIDVSGEAGPVSVTAMSGRVSIESAEHVDIRSTSGKVTVDHSKGTCRIRAQSGAVTVSSCEDADISTATGRIELGAARGDVKAHCVSGRIKISMAEAHNIDAETVSGRIKVELPSGTNVHHTQNRADVAPAGTDCVVLTRTVSGNVTVTNR